MNAKTLLPILIFANLFLLISLSQNVIVSPFRNITTIEDLINKTIVAGSTSKIKISFVHKGIIWSPLVIRLNITPIDSAYNLEGNEFSVTGILETFALPGTGIDSYIIELICTKPPIRFDETGDEFNPEENILTYYCYNDLFYIVRPLSLNYLSLSITPHPAIVPTKFNITLELLSEIGIIVLEPIVEIRDGKGSLYIGHPYDEYLEFYLRDNQSLNLSVTAYSQLFIGIVPRERPVGIAYFDFRNQTPFNGPIEIRYYFNPNTLIVKNLDVNNLRFYKLENNMWKLVPASGVFIINETLAFTYAILNSLSIYGIFTSYYTPQPLIQQITQTIYTPIPTPSERVIVEKPIYYNITNITQPIIERITELPKPVCGNNVCEVGEDWRNCPSDCPQPTFPPTQPIAPTGLLILAEPSALAVIIVISFFTALAGIYVGMKLFRKD